MKILGFLDEEVGLRTFDFSEFRYIKYKPQYATYRSNTPGGNYDPQGVFKTHYLTGDSEEVGILKDGRRVSILLITNDELQ